MHSSDSPLPSTVHGLPGEVNQHPNGSPPEPSQWRLCQPNVSGSCAHIACAPSDASTCTFHVEIYHTDARLRLSRQPQLDGAPRRRRSGDKCDQNQANPGHSSARAKATVRRRKSRHKPPARCAGTSARNRASLCRDERPTDGGLTATSHKDNYDANFDG